MDSLDSLIFHRVFTTSRAMLYQERKIVMQLRRSWLQPTRTLLTFYSCLLRRYKLINIIIIGLGKLCFYLLGNTYFSMFTKSSEPILISTYSDISYSQLTLLIILTISSVWFFSSSKNILSFYLSMIPTIIFYHAIISLFFVYKLDFHVGSS